MLCGYHRAYRKYPIVKTVHFMLTNLSLHACKCSVLLFFSFYVFYFTTYLILPAHLSKCYKYPLFSDIFHFIHFSSRLVFGVFFFLVFFFTVFACYVFCPVLPFYFFFFLISLNSLSVFPCSLLRSLITAF